MTSKEETVKITLGGLEDLLSLAGANWQNPYAFGDKQRNAPGVRG
jgi:hypothetical protein